MKAIQVEPIQISQHCKIKNIQCNYINPISLTPTLMVNLVCGSKLSVDMLPDFPFVFIIIIVIIIIVIIIIITTISLYKMSGTNRSKSTFCNCRGEPRVLPFETEL